ncbi:hypothetical protein HIM_07147 [Hirsutella minnesotensis 3608]|uniref:Serine-rich protein n=1 Tax=Hirsutella minnesotensis 3608 TaxID=1043627 RepID=A0A0F7ZTM1_9HYPO|nr:hypothetical protein HIM_07147 [Hirsutella minnesotensis 3608]
MSTHRLPSSDRRVLHERTPSENNRLQIRLVPYTPPRLSFEGSLPTSSSAGSDTETPNVRKASLQSSPDIIESPKGKSPDRLSEGHGDLGISAPTQATSARVSAEALSRSDGHSKSQSSNRPARKSRSKQQLESPDQASLRRWPRITGFNADRFLPSLPYSLSASSATYSSRSAQQSTAISGSSRQPSSSHLFAIDQPSSPQTFYHEQAPSQGAKPVFHGSSISSSPTWNHRFMDSLRKVHRRSAISKQKTQGQASGTITSNARLHVRLRKTGTSPQRDVEQATADVFARSPASELVRLEMNDHEMRNRDASSARPTQDHSAINSVGSELADSSPASSRPNVEIFGGSLSAQSMSDLDAPSEANYLTYGATPSLTPRRRSNLSGDSLHIAPLRPPWGRSAHLASISRTRSRTSSHAGSFSSVSTGIIIEEATRSLLSGGTPICVSTNASRQTSSSRPLDTNVDNSRWALFRPPQWSFASSSDASRVATSGGEQVDGSEIRQGGAGPSGLGTATGVGRSATRKAGDGRSKSTRLSAEVPEHPSPVYRRGSSRDQNPNTIRLIRNQDEHGDGLADLENLGHHPNRSRLHSLLSSQSSDRNLHSSSSSRSGSFSRSPIPTWARLYYGSGERKFLAAKISSESLFSDFTSYSGAASFLSRSPSAERFPTTLRSPRRRPREAASPSRHGIAPARCDDSEVGSCHMSPWTTRLRQQPSSVWSPHLRRDRRASGYGIWEPPSAVWSTNTSLLSRKNTQPILFVLGFIFPFAWLIASFLPLPRVSGPEMTQVDPSTSHLNLQLEANPTMGTWDMRLYNHARWWRTLNRAMSIVGIFLVGAIVALIVFGVRQRWKS